MVLRERLRVAVENVNPDVPIEAREQALREVWGLFSQILIENNEAFHEMLTKGVSVEYQRDGDTVGDKVWLVNSIIRLIVSSQYIPQDSVSRSVIFWEIGYRFDRFHVFAEDVSLSR